MVLAGYGLVYLLSAMWCTHRSVIIISMLVLLLLLRVGNGPPHRFSGCSVDATLS